MFIRNNCYESTASLGFDHHFFITGNDIENGRNLLEFRDERRSTKIFISGEKLLTFCVARIAGAAVGA